MTDTGTPDNQPPRKQGNPISDNANPRLVTLSLTDTELVGHLSRNAAAEAINEVRARLNLLLGAVAIILAILAGGAAIYVDNRIENDVEAQVSEELDRRLDGAISSAVMLPLLVSEANSIFASDQYFDEDAELIMRILQQLKPDIDALTPDARLLAERRIEVIIDTFIGAGDLTRVMRIHEMFDGSLINQAGIFWSLCRAVALGLIEHPDFAIQNHETIAEILGTPLAPASSPFEQQRIVAILVAQSADGWSEEGLTEAIRAETARWDGFSAFFEDFVLDRSYERFEIEEGLLHSTVSVERLGVLRRAWAAASG